MATKNRKLARKSSKRPKKEGVQIETHFESLEEKALSEALDILASMIYEYLKGGKDHE